MAKRGKIKYVRFLYFLVFISRAAPVKGLAEASHRTFLSFYFPSPAIKRPPCDYTTPRGSAHQLRVCLRNHFHNNMRMGEYTSHPACASVASATHAGESQHNEPSTHVTANVGGPRTAA